MLFFLAEFAQQAEEICPVVCFGAIQKCTDMGFSAMGALEFEFFVFEETPHSIREKGYRNLKPITPGNFGYSVIRNSVWAELYHTLLDQLEAMDIPIEGLHTETGPGVLEAAITVDNVLKAADNAALFKTFTKVIAQREGLMATFMAKWSPDYPGQSGHTHISLRNQDGSSAFYAPEGRHNMSPIMEHGRVSEIRCGRWRWWHPRSIPTVVWYRVHGHLQTQPGV